MYIYIACHLTDTNATPNLHTSAYVSIRQHTSAYVSIRQHTSACHLADTNATPNLLPAF